MATIVESLQDNAVYILLGAGFGAYNTLKPFGLLETLDSNKEPGQISVLAVCDFNGKVGWIRSDQVKVISVDGQSPEEVLLQTPDPK